MEPANILIIDDEASICNACSAILKERRHKVDVSMTGKAGLDAVFRGNHDVILLDLRLPDADGMEILGKVRSERPGECVIVMTGYSSVQTAVEAMKLGAFDYLSKPFSDDELVLTVERAIEKKRLIEENISLKKELVDRFSFANIVGENPQIVRIFEEITRVAPTDCTVLVMGEHGTGKELFARAIHAHSNRATKQFVAIDCGSLSSTLLESELFGHVRGAFTGAIQDKAGIFEVAQGSTLFLDDIANVGLETQAKLLRVLESHEYKPVGSSQIKISTARIISATNRDLRAMVREGTFREDLFYRLNAFPIYIPPLRERKDDIPRLAYYFLRHFCRKMDKRISGFSEDALEALVRHEWPGNVRQLKNAVERLVIMADRETLDLLYLLDHLQTRHSWTGKSVPQNLKELKTIKNRLLADTFEPIEKAFLIHALDSSGWNVSRASARVGMKRPNFSALMKKHKLTRSIDGHKSKGDASL